jgi:Protein  of unknown function (DUF3018)
MVKTNSQTVRDHRLRLRAQGLRPVQLWLPDSRTPAFAEQAAHDMRVLAEDQALLDAFERSAVEDFAGEWR